jgi:biopolymer transport protein ExbD
MQNIIVPSLKLKSPEISMAPLIDIVFLLLVFFMVTTVFPDKGLTIEKPTSAHTTRLTDKNLNLYLDKKGLVFYKKQQLTKDDIKRLIKTQTQLESDLAVIIHADKRTITEHLIQVFDIAKSSGAKQLGISTDDKVEL